ncbi:MAG: hypothetical protein M5R38_19015 [Candidatus Methylomirabilis sp.]|nr:hypothetical protein [Candidatus Methylomirabilis sp.]
MQLGNGEQITTVIPIRQFEVDRYLLMATRRGIVKKTELNAYGHPRAGGIIAITLDEGDELIAVRLTKGDDEVLLGTKQGMAIRFKEDEVRSAGRAARGVKGISLEAGDEVVGAEVVAQDAAVLTVTERGYGKRTDPQEYRLQSRGGKGIINIRVTDRNGPAVGVMLVQSGDQIMMISQEGRITRMRVDEISLIGRATQECGCRGLELSDRVAAVTRLVSDDEGDGEAEGPPSLPEPEAGAEPARRGLSDAGGRAIVTPLLLRPR